MNNSKIFRKNYKGILIGLVGTIVIFSILFIVIGYNAIFAAQSNMIINEVMASNKSTITDNNSEYSDWIELYNSSSQTLNLSGYSISDGSATYTIKNGSIPAKGFLMIWASDLGDAATGEIHTNFKLSSSGEIITLLDSNNNVLDTLEYEPISNDESYGRKVDGESTFVIFSKATPGKSNTGGIEMVVEPGFSHEGGFYTTAFNLTLQSSEQNAKIYYTTNGSDPEPGKSGTNEYTTGINIKSRAGDPNVLSMISNIGGQYIKFTAPKTEVFKCSTIKAITVSGNGVKSKVATKTFWVDPGMKSRYNVPVISMVTDQANLFDINRNLCKCR